MNSDRLNVREYHHHVPKFLLKKFSHKDPKLGSVIHTLDVCDGNISIEPVKKIGGGWNDNDINCSMEGFNIPSRFLEDSYKILEGWAAPVLKKIISSKILPELGSDEYQKIVLFVAAQYIREPARKIDFAKSVESFINIKEEYNDIFENLKYLKVNSVIEAALAIEKMKLSIIFSSSSDNLIISDNPFSVIYNKNIKIPSNIAFMHKLSLPGSISYLPISPKVCLKIQVSMRGLGYDFGIGTSRGLDRNEINALNMAQKSCAIRHVFAKNEEDF
ncbi:DUF4238 domain-containing protein [Sphingobium yanoikuyae]|uniref:DUF4238 domain-containing protein n=1 Tax=Sphingobium yanoikuyae TaxID=13690 RepID=UPI0022DE4816|nr:DUF4238 domain-containing protein [Sphingobium yanoikuyae]WBQ16266.1 DUF4238 domain-containing protein [Sphingobium yanoikuyae]